MPMLQETLAIRPASKSAAWKALEDHQRKMRDVCETSSRMIPDADSG
jgi:hypothetical protein